MAPSISGPSHLVNPLATAAHLETSASQLDGVPKELEDSVRYETAKLLQAAGILLRLPQDIIAQSIVILMRALAGPDGRSLLEVDAKASPAGSKCFTIHISQFAGLCRSRAVFDRETVSDSIGTSITFDRLLVS